MNSQLVNALKLKMQPVAIILTDDKPADGLHFQERKRGCVAAMLVAASKKNRIAFFDRKTFGCPGGGTGLGFGNRYRNFPIDCLLSTGIKEMANQTGRAGAAARGERFYKKVLKWLGSGLIRCRLLTFRPSMWCLNLGNRSQNRTNQS